MQTVYSTTQQHSEYIIRRATVDDAVGYHAYRQRLIDEPDNMITLSAGEYTRTADDERDRIRSTAESPDQLLLVVVAKNQIIGSCACRGVPVPALRHVVGLGIDIDCDYRGQGIGKALMQTVIEWADNHPAISRIELDVFTHNHRAISLYVSCGFVIEGRKQRAYYKYNRYVDAYQMARLIDKP